MIFKSTTCKLKIWCTIHSENIFALLYSFGGRVLQANRKYFIDMPG